MVNTSYLETVFSSSNYSVYSREGWNLCALRFGLGFGFG